MLFKIFFCFQVFYGTFSATEIAYFTYIYANVDTEYFPQVTSHTRAAILAGRAVSGISAQFLISYNTMDYRQLNYITFAGKLYFISLLEIFCFLSTYSCIVLIFHFISLVSTKNTTLIK